ncbi:MAG: hypothetical protein WBB73_14630 [Candidatus Aminicenantaceae bacterium]
MSEAKEVRRFVATVVLAWLTFLALDFLVHATLLRTLWARDLPALKSPEEMFRLIPFGYLSFLLLTLLLGVLYWRVHPDGGSPVQGLRFGALVGVLFAVSNFLGWYSFLALPLDMVALTSLGYWLEFTAAGLVFGFLIPPSSIKKRAWIVIGVVLLILVVSIVFQNLGDVLQGTTLENTPF